MRCLGGAGEHGRGEPQGPTPTTDRTVAPCRGEAGTWLGREEGTTVLNEVTFACLGERMRLTVLKNGA